MSKESLVKTTKDEEKESSARKGFNALHRISELLDCGLDRKSLAICCRLCQMGLDPEIVANAVATMKKSAQEYRLQNGIPNEALDR